MSPTAPTTLDAPPAPATRVAPDSEPDSAHGRPARAAGTDRRPDRPRRAGATRRGGRRKPVRHVLVVTHRWLSLVLGVVLLLVTTSGAVLLYEPEIQRALAPQAWQGGGGPVRVSMQQAREAVLAAHPTASAEEVRLVHGLYRVADGEGAWTVDPSSGTVVGQVPPPPEWLGVVENLHLCILACDDMPGHVAPMSVQIPHTAALGWDGDDMTVGSFLLATMAVLLVYLCVSGLWLWFPRPGRWRAALTVRWRKGRFARDLDLHKVVGVAALVPLLVWGLTGAGFEMDWTRAAWLAVTPGTEVPKGKAVSIPATGPDVSVDTAVAAARALQPGHEVVRVRLPKEDPTSAYTVFMNTGIGPAGGDLPGALRVGVDRHTGAATIVRGDPSRPAAQRLWDDWNYPLHSGWVVNGWWRLVWLAGALSPLVLAVTGVSTWLVRRRTARTRRRAAARRASTQTATSRVPHASARVEKPVAP